MPKIIYALLLVAAAAASLWAQAADTAPPAAVSAVQPEIRNPKSAMPDVAACIRLSQLAPTDVWKQAADPRVGLIGPLAKGLGLALDPSKDVAEALVAVWLKPADDDGGAADEIGYAVSLTLTRDMQPKDIFTDPRGPAPAAGIALPVYAVGDGLSAVLPGPAKVVIATPDCLKAMLDAAATPASRDRNVADIPDAAGERRPPESPLALALAAPGEIALAARVSPDLKDAVRTHYARYARETLKPDLPAEQLMQFALIYNIVRVVQQAEAITASLDLSRPADAVRAEVAFASPAMAPFSAAVLQALADPLAMGVPAVMGGQPLEEPPAEGFYKVVADGPAVRLTLSKKALEALVARLTAALRMPAATRASADNLRALGEAIRAYAAAKGEYPKTWSDLIKGGQVREVALFENPAMPEHLVTGDYELVPLTAESASRRSDQKVLAYEVYPADARPATLNVLLADGHVQSMTYETFQVLYKQTLESLGR